MKRWVAIAAALMVVAAACGGDEAGSCEGVADEAVGLVQELVDEMSAMSLEDLAALGDDEPQQLQDFEARAETLEQRADDLGCSDDDMRTLVEARLGDLESDSQIGQLIIDGIQQEGIFND